VTTHLVVDSSAVIAMLLDEGTGGQWAADTMRGATLAAPSLIAFECANVLRRHESAGLIGHGVAAQAHADLLDLPIEQWPYETVAARAWELRPNLTSYDASYVALAELLGVPLVTLDRRLAGSPGLRCDVRTQ
jgi:predicted nucleic acid-binding protein